MLRINMISVWIVFSMAVILGCINKKQYKLLGKFIVMFSVGFMIIILPILCWLYFNNALVDFINCYIVFNLEYCSSTNAYGQATVSNRIEAFFFFLNNSVGILALLIILYKVWKKKDILSISYLLYYVSTLWSIALSGRISGHYAMILIPAFVYPYALLGQYVEKGSKELVNKKYIAIVYLMITICMAPWIGQMESLISKYKDKSESQFSEVVYDIQKIVKENTTEDDRITVYGNWNIVYMATERMSASKYSYQFPIGQIMPQIMDDYFEELSVNQPEMIIMVEPSKEMDRMKAFINRNAYKLYWMEEVEEDEYSVLIYKRS